MMLRILIPLAALLLSVVATVAQDVPPAPKVTDKAEDIPPEEWRELARGRTLTYRIDGQFWALEQYSPSGDSVRIQIKSGECMDGQWTHTEGAYCFAWESGEISCFRHARIGEQILIIPVENGLQSGTIQTMVNISDTPLACGPALSS